MFLLLDLSLWGRIRSFAVHEGRGSFTVCGEIRQRNGTSSYPKRNIPVTNGASPLLYPAAWGARMRQAVRIPRPTNLISLVMCT